MAIAFPIPPTTATLLIGGGTCETAGVPYTRGGDFTAKSATGLARSFATSFDMGPFDDMMADLN